MTDSAEKKTIEREIAFHNDRYLSQSENRSATDKYYCLKKAFDQRFLESVIRHSKGKKVLEIGCGPNINTPHFIDTAKECHGIDVSNVAIDQAWSRLGKREEHVHLTVMNAESMDYEDNYFDVVCGKGIIHHLDIRKAYDEIARVLKTDGVAIFIEPLGHNPFINAYRKFTPNMRSEDEHPLMINDIRMASDHFWKVEVEYQHISTILSAYIPGGFVHNGIFTMLNTVDKSLMKLFPFIRKYSWMAYMELSNPKSS